MSPTATPNAAGKAKAWQAVNPHRVSSFKALSAGALLLFVLVIISVMMGPRGATVSAANVFRSLMDHLPILHLIPHTPAIPEADTIVWQFRLPRALVAMMIGALLGYAGVALQGLLMNPLADPYTVGVSSGAAVGAALAETLGLGALFIHWGFSPFAADFAGVGMAFAMAIGAVTVVYTVARVAGRVSVHTFLLAGVVVGTFLWSMIPLLMVLANRSKDLERIMFYLIGSLQGADWARVGLLFPFVIVSAFFLRNSAQDLNLMTLGEESAAHLGVEIEPLKRRILLISSLATAAAVSVGGIIAFVGLVVPHLARRLVGPDHRALLPLSALFGAALLLISDTLVRAPFGDGLPVGVVTSLVGAPAFCWLLRRRRAVAW